MITSVQRRRRWLTAEKIRLVEETMQPGMSVSYMARRPGVAPVCCSTGVDDAGSMQAVQAGEDVAGTNRVRELERRMRELERLLGRNTVEVEILKEALDVARAENRAERLEVPIDSRAILNRMRGSVLIHREWGNARIHFRDQAH